MPCIFSNVVWRNGHNAGRKEILSSNSDTALDSLCVSCKSVCLCFTICKRGLIILTSPRGDAVIMSLISVRQNGEEHHRKVYMEMNNPEQDLDRVQ